MGFAEKLSHKVQEMRGRVKRNAGQVTGDPGLEARGTADETVGNLKQAGDKVKDAFGGRRARRRRSGQY